MNALIVADDLTGAMDTGHQFATRGYETAVRVRWSAEESDSTHTSSAASRTTVLSVNTDTRYADAAVSYKIVSSVVGDAVAADERTHTPLVYKKVDSTLRGNVVTELEAAVDAAGATLAIVAPAFPAAGRVTRDGTHLVDGVPLEETEYAADEKGPATAHLPTLLSASGYPVTHVPLEVVAGGVNELAAILESVAETADAEETPQCLVFDAVEPAHLESIADATADCGERVVYIGSGGLARHVTVPGSRDVRETEETPGRTVRDGTRETEQTDQKEQTEQTRRTDQTDQTEHTDVSRTGALGIVGSVNERTLAQLEAVPPSWVTTLESERTLESPDAAGEVAGVCASERLTTEEAAVITGARSKRDVEETLAIGRRNGHDAETVRDRVSAALASAARTAVDESSDPGPPTGLFVTGGDVAGTVFEALEVTEIELLGTEVGSGIPVGRLEGGPADGTTVVTKAGGFGAGSAIVNTLNRLRRSDTK